jgi:hypothetical protein
MDETTDNGDPGLVMPVESQGAINEAPEISPIDIQQLSVTERLNRVEQALGISN